VVLNDMSAWPGNGPHALSAMQSLSSGKRRGHGWKTAADPFRNSAVRFAVMHNAGSQSNTAPAASPYSPQSAARRRWPAWPLRRRQIIKSLVGVALKPHDQGTAAMLCIRRSLKAQTCCKSVCSEFRGRPATSIGAFWPETRDGLLGRRALERGALFSE
jgi:hypothetical protein